MKFLNVLLITLFATTLFWGCSDDDDSTAGVNSSGGQKGRRSKCNGN